MNLKEKVENLLSQQEFPVLLKNLEKQRQTDEILSLLGVDKNSEYYELYTKYFLRALDRRDGTPEIIDPCPPQGFKAANFAHEVWEIPKNYILFTTGEGDGGYLYNVKDNSVWDFTLGQQKLLSTDNLTHWNSFYEFMIWYLTPEENK